MASNTSWIVKLRFANGPVVPAQRPNMIEPQ